MDYHAHNRSQDDIMWIPADGSTFKDKEKIWKNFKEPHNLKILLAIGDVNLFGDMRFVYSVSSIFVINNNIPP